MALTFPYTAEEIESKLSLIDKNKNLVPYPYDIQDLPESLEDVGDGSFLTIKDTISVPDNKILLKTYGLPKGTYTVSVEVASILDATKVVTDSGFSLSIEGANVEAGQFKLSAETTAIKVYLDVPTSGFDTGLVIKPMIAIAGQTANWVPYMGTIGSYVDERFNSTNAKIKALTDSLVPGLGMPTKDEEGNTLTNDTKYIPMYIDGQWVAVKISVYDGETL